MWNSSRCCKLMSIKKISKYLYISNPFYIISAVLVLYGIYSLLNTGEVSEEKTWRLALTLMIYSSTLNVVGLILIRLKKVWEDSRTLVVLTLLLLMATPMILDDYLIKNQEKSLLALSIYYAFVFFNVNAFFMFSKIKLPFFFHFFVHLSLAIYVFYPK